MTGWQRQMHRAIGRTIAPPRFLAVLVLLPLAAGAYHRLVPGTAWTAALAVGFDVAAAVFLASLLPLLRHGAAAEIRTHADANSANRLMVLVVTTLLMLVTLAAIAGELPAARRGDPVAAGQLIVTLLLAWAFANSVYSLHYAHEYYTPHPGSGADHGGLDFPGTPEPAYIDFAYFAFTLGMTFQTSDVAITAGRMRGVAILHSFAAFVFNIGVIAFTINALGGGG
ncbi:DUF1345 domain-containing protein [Novosphingobium aerophilum]|nr:DUF1345 domain-containing protein [Novosphingobium aerophilum]